MLTMDDIQLATPDDLADPIQLLKDSEYRWGNLQAVRYDPSRTDLFPGPSFLVELWERCRAAGGGKIGPLGILPALFCGVRDLGCENIVALLRKNPLFVLGEWRSPPLPTSCAVCGKHIFTSQVTGRTLHDSTEADIDHDVVLPLQVLAPQFHPLGFCFPVGDPLLAAPALQPANRNAIFAGYAFFDNAWRTRQQRVLTWLGITALFGEFRSAAVHGVRFHDNHLTARWMAQFGFSDVGTIPHYLYSHSSGDLTAGVVSTLTRAHFSMLLSEIMTQIQTTPEPTLPTLPTAPLPLSE